MPVTYPFPVQRTRIHDKIEMAWCAAGEGPETLLFIHGLANYAPVWTAQLHGLSDQYRCIAVDLPGNGLSSRDEYPYSMFFYAESVARFISEQKLSRLTLCGHSMGGQIALMLALRYPHLFDRLVLIAPAGFEYFSPTDIMWMEQALQFGRLMGNDETYLESSIRQSFYADKSPAAHIIKDLKALLKAGNLQQWHHMAVSSIKAMLNESVNQYLHQVQHQSLVIFGEEDAMIPNRLLHLGETTSGIARKGAALMAHADLHMVKGAGHFVMIEKAEEVNRIIRGFLKG